MEQSPQTHHTERVYIVRHAESRYNAAVNGTLKDYDDSLQPSWDPELIDAMLSERGIR